MFLRAVLRPAVNNQKRFLVSLSSTLNELNLTVQENHKDTIDPEANSLLCKYKIENDYKNIELLSQKQDTGSIYRRHMTTLYEVIQKRKSYNELKRLEIVGNSFLDFAVAINLYCTNENVKAGVMTGMRLEQISYKNLCRLGSEKVFDHQMISQQLEASSDEQLNFIPSCIGTMIGAYLIDCGARSALYFISWLGLQVLANQPEDGDTTRFTLKSPLHHRSTTNAEKMLDFLLHGFEVFEQKLNYKFKDRYYLLQAVAHNSYAPNQLTESYQRLEFIGDAVLNYLITRSLYDISGVNSYVAMKEVKAALISNTVLSSLAFRHDFHKYFRHLTPGLNEIIDRFEKVHNVRGYSISEEYYLISNHSVNVEEPKVLADMFESVAGAIYLDSSMSLDTVWRVYGKMLQPEIEKFSKSFVKSAVAELISHKQEAVKFGKPEYLPNEHRVRVAVEILGEGVFQGIGRNQRIAKLEAAKNALRKLKLKHDPE